MEKLKAIETTLIPIALIDTNDGQVEGLPRNPRLIRDEKFKRLKENIEKHSEFLEYNTLYVFPQGGRYVTICGNMRLQACRDLGFEEMPCKVFPEDTTAEKLKAYTILDNVAFGDNDWDALANEWDSEELLALGMDVWHGEDNGIMEDTADDGVIPTDLDCDNIQKPFVAKITFVSAKELNEFQKNYYAVLKDKYDCTISISGGEL